MHLLRHRARCLLATMAGLLLLIGMQVPCAAAVSQLDVRVTVSISYTLDVTWFDDSTTDKTWAIGTIALNGITHTNDTPDLRVKNKTTVPVDLAVGLIDPTTKALPAMTWSHVLSAGHGGADQFTVRAANVATPTGPGAGFAPANSYTFALPAGVGSTVTYATGVAASNGVQPLNLAFWAPASVTTVNPGSIVARIVATAH